MAERALQIELHPSALEEIQRATGEVTLIKGHIAEGRLTITGIQHLLASGQEAGKNAFTHDWPSGEAFAHNWPSGGSFAHNWPSGESFAHNWPSGGGAAPAGGDTPD